MENAGEFHVSEQEFEINLRKPREFSKIVLYQSKKMICGKTVLAYNICKDNERKRRMTK